MVNIVAENDLDLVAKDGLAVAATAPAQGNPSLMPPQTSGGIYNWPVFEDAMTLHVYRKHIAVQYVDHSTNPNQLELNNCLTRSFPVLLDLT